MKYIIAECYKYKQGELIDWGRYFIFKDKLPKWEHCKFEILLETEDYLVANETLKRIKMGGNKMNTDDTIRHIYFHKGFKLEELEKYGFVKSEGWGYYELWINNKLAISVPVGRRRPKGGKYHLSFESCYDKPSIAMLFIVIKMANDGMFELFEETREGLKRKKIEKLENEIKKLKGGK